eukprot:TRINITY_DN5026_c0_g1_i1.p1 TRINITY_DN5026_c0_g1~~TRINITY_DN5026_c0_g1_i1.p1  ORF type:complete len:91 (-),score=2.31 TRINITY_DN5026_c0_g1_i1:96-368(-)
MSILTQRSSGLKSFESIDEDMSPQTSIPKLLTDLPIQPISSSGFSHHSNVPQIKNMKSSGTQDNNSVEKLVSEHESANTAKVQNYDDYNI